MGNCQAIDNASLVIQQPSGRVDKMYVPVPASDIMKTNPGYYVALLLTTTLYPPSSATATAVTATNNEPLRITRIKLLRPTDNLLLGHTYRLVSSQEVMKGLWAKKYAKKQNNQAQPSGKEVINSSSKFENIAAATKGTLEGKAKQVIKHAGHPTKTSSSTNSATARPKGWHPSLLSINEAAS
ncbi:Chromodomain-helicase-DNA-binding protein like [Heracleum sosnowskyi]|uniref:Chromodomain-helicase-DNA-binding protein like n=1 Tax=Heracleum sosnowskyi TaxID=360622 RepID=A0AAD8MII3_9APIA|nr:Chromodomain-helicase-DNA-binding protein like [Heracleum sosnowskyi]